MHRKGRIELEVGGHYVAANCRTFRMFREVDGGIECGMILYGTCDQFGLTYAFHKDGKGWLDDYDIIAEAPASMNEAA